MEDHYQTLGVERSATAAEIKKAYRRLAHKYHPDKNGGNEDKFKQVNAAYQVLGNETKRSQYDQFGHAGSNGYGQGVNMDYGDFEGLGDIFEQFFGGRGPGRTRSVRRGNDVSIDLTISFEESAFGITKEVRHRIFQTCSKCHGNGAQPGTPIKDCSRCQGSGHISVTRNTMLGSFAQRAVCPDCQGEGKKAQTLCKQCHGEGREVSDRTLDIKVPAGIADGQAIKLSSKGEAPPRGGVNGDLYATIHVRPHPKLKREGNNILIQTEIGLADAALGTTIKVPTLSGDKEVKVPAGTQPGATVKLSSLGFPSLSGSGQGDQLITFNVKVPIKLSRKQRHLLEQFRAAKTSLFK